MGADVRSAQRQFCKLRFHINENFAFIVVILSARPEPMAKSHLDRFSKISKHGRGTDGHILQMFAAVDSDRP
jgi:hypothetical protein